MKDSQYSDLTKAVLQELLLTLNTLAIDQIGKVISVSTAEGYEKKIAFENPQTGKFYATKSFINKSEHKDFTSPSLYEDLDLIDILLVGFQNR